jgi:hypothetical protein
LLQLWIARYGISRFIERDDASPLRLMPETFAGITTLSAIRSSVSVASPLAGTVSVLPSRLFALAWLASAMPATASIDQAIAFCDATKNIGRCSLVTFSSVTGTSVSTEQRYLASEVFIT